MANLPHHRTRDHSGTQLDTVVVLSSDIGRYAVGTSVHDVLVDLVARLNARSSANTTIGGFSAAAWLYPFRIRANALIYAPGSGAGSFTADALVGFRGTLSGASIVRRGVAKTFSADGYLVP